MLIYFTEHTSQTQIRVKLVTEYMRTDFGKIVSFCGASGVSVLKCEPPHVYEIYIFKEFDFDFICVIEVYR